MDAKEIFLFLRLRSKRRKKPSQKEHLEKKLIALENERLKVRAQIFNLGYEPLVPPVQKGWKRIFVLRDDVRKSARAAFFEELLKKINTVQYSDSKKFLVRRRKRGRKIYVSRGQKLREIYEWEWDRLKLSDSERFYFTETIRSDHKREFKLHVFNESWRFVLKVIPNMITLIRKKDSLLEQRLDEIENYLIRNNLQGKLGKVCGYSRYYKPFDEKLKYDDPLKNIPLYKIVGEYFEDELK